MTVCDSRNNQMFLGYNIHVRARFPSGCFSSIKISKNHIKSCNGTKSEVEYFSLAQQKKTTDISESNNILWFK